MGKDIVGTTYAFVVAVENYQQPSVNTVEFAASDAKAFREVLVSGFNIPAGHITLWIDQEVTQNRLQNDIPYAIRQLGPDERFIFFYAGHGFFAKGVNRLTTWDTHPSNIVGTTTSLEELLFSPLREVGRKSLMFIDACAADICDIAAFSRDMISGMNSVEFESFVRSRDYTAAFFSCSPAEKSYSSPSLKHGIWTHHLVKALKGEAKGALRRDGFITDDSLRSYLSAAVPAYIREKTKIKGKQSPYALIGSNGPFEILRIPEQASVGTPLPRVTFRFSDAYFRSRETRPYERTEGFDRRKGHTVPIALSDNADAWAGRLLHSEMIEELETIQEQAKSVLKLKRREITMDVNSANGGTVDTEYFRYDIFAGQNPADPAEVRMERQIALRVPAEELPSEFDEIFPESVNEVVVPLSLSKGGYDSLADALETLADTKTTKLKEIRSRQFLGLNFPDLGLEISFDVRGDEMVIKAVGRTGCLPLIEVVRTDALALLIGTVPTLIGSPRP